MTQGSTVVSTTPPLPGLQLVQQINTALQTIGTNFAGPSDPAALAGPFMTWADTANGLLKRRNAAGSAWISVGPLLGDVARIAGDASQRFKAAPAVATDEVTVRSQVAGLDQTVQNVTASRAQNVAYTNSTGKAIIVFVEAVTPVANTSLQARIAGVLCAIASYPTGGATIGITFTVPAGATYAVFLAAGTITTWSEYR